MHLRRSNIGAFLKLLLSFEAACLLSLSCKENPGEPADASSFFFDLDVQSNRAILTGSPRGLTQGATHDLSLIQRPYEGILTITNYASGSGELIVSDAPGIALFIDSLSSNHQTRFQIPWNLKIRSITYSAINLSADVNLQINPIGLNVLNQPDFPNELGNRWVYEWSDSTQSRIDTVTVTVIGLRRHETGPIARIWTVNYRAYHSVDTMFTYRNGDTTTIAGGIERWRFHHLSVVHPQKTGVTMPREPPSIWVYVVDRVDSIAVPAGIFLFSYRYSSLPVDDIECRSSYRKWWVQDGVGIVKRYRFFCGGNIRELWRLVSFTTPYYSNP